MGYFSNVDLQQQAHYRERPDHSYPSQQGILEYYLETLTAKLEELNEIRPHDPLHPDYDRYFYKDYNTHYNESPNTVQGLLAAIAEVKEKIHEEQEKRVENLKFYMSAFLTGADPEGQCVLIDAFDPPADGILTVAA